ncbi:tetratricopeptide repeat protein [Dechloromonas sp. XY25]|uniref:Tetratricopeptide repeat protein n=1 Tax=Dechloromonas hankyongensis TaxID=2908002 RepID=A0ABS9K7G9_9RHOO|nr:tetratricopeptide repeat protein [Dechloromonas hankyongensis]MCG2579096.1 tetratricopeptide repeat protein [Dechloromonas hankyongensis]
MTARAQPIDKKCLQALQETLNLHKAGLLREAEKGYLAVLKRWPMEPLACYNLGVLKVQSKQATESLPYFKRLVETRPVESQYWLAYIDALIQSGQSDVVAGVVERAKRQARLSPQAIAAIEMRLSGPPPEALRALLDDFNSGRHTECEQQARQLSETFPQHALSWKVLGAALHAQQRFADALAAMQKCAELMPDDAETCNSLGAIVNELKRHDEAIRYFQRALQLNPDYPEAHNNLGNAFKAQSNVSEAEACYRRAVAIRADFSVAQNNLAQILLTSGKYPEAIAVYRQILDKDSRNTDAYLNLGSAFHLQGALEEAEAAYRTVLELNPGFVEAHVNLGNVLQDKLQHGAAESCYREALRHAPDNFLALNNLGASLKLQGRFPESEDACRQALALSPHNALALLNLGNALSEQGKFEEAKTALRGAIAQAGNFAEAHYSLADTSLFSSEIEAARRAYLTTAELASGTIRLDAIIGLAVLDFLDSKPAACRDRLESIREIVTLAGPGSSIAANYWFYLDQLLKQHPEPAGLPPAGNAMEVIGESHALAAHGLRVGYHGTDYHCRAHWISGCKEWHLGNDHPNKFKHRFTALLAELPRQSTILLCIGEIDCRPDEGILKAWRASPGKSISDIARSTAEGYLRFVDRTARPYGHQLIVSGVPCTNLDLADFPEEHGKQLVEVIRSLNTHLRTLTGTYDMDFLNVFTLSDRGDGIADGTKHLDRYHLLPASIAKAFTLQTTISSSTNA